MKSVYDKINPSKEPGFYLAEVSPNAIFVHQKGKIVFANLEACRILRAVNKEELLGRDIEECMVFENDDFLNERLEMAINGEKLPFVECKLKTLDQQERDFELSEVGIIFDGEPAVMVVGRDVTEEKRHRTEIIETKQRYKSLFEYNANSVYSFDLNGFFTSCNRACQKLSGYSKDELLTMHYHDLFTKPEERIHIDQYFKSVKKGSPQTFRTTIQRKNGALVPINVTILPIVVNGQCEGVYGIAQDVTEQVQIEKANEYMAYHDYLTGLPNRNMLNTRLPEMLALAATKKQKIAILFIDLDRFKLINDTLGHTKGDILLIEVTKRLKRLVNENDLIFRQSGDEFIVVLTDADRAVASKVEKRIAEALAIPFRLNDEDIYVSMSIGTSLFPDDGETLETLVRHADFVMYQKKKSGKNLSSNYRPFSNDLDLNVSPLKLEMELRKTIEQNGLSLYYQPKVNFKTGNIVGVEALLRWNHQDLGDIPPQHFIPIAEESGLIIPIGEWALYTACKQNKEWQKKGFSTVVSVNLSARQFTHYNLIHTIERVLKETGLEPQYLEIEITESIMMDIERAISTMQQLKNLGVHISIDDFGIGYSSLNYLKKFPIDTLKIDSSFVRELSNNPNDETIVKTIISMAHNLGLNVVAEGVETKEQLVFLQQHLCDEGQGFFFSQALPAKDFEERIQSIQKMVREHGISQDVNEQMWIEELLRAAKKELQDTVRLHQGMIMKFKKINGRFIHTLADGELLYRFGLIPAQIVGKELFEILPERSAARKTKYYQRAWEGEEFVSYEDQLNGIYYLATLRPIKRGGEVVEVIVSCMDITPLKAVEEALRESEYKYRLIAENMTDLILILDRNVDILYASPSHEFVLGHSVNLIEGKNGTENVHPDDVELLLRKCEQSFQTKSRFQVELRTKHANGNWVLVEFAGTPVIGKDGEVEHIIAVGRDITEKRQAEERLLKSEKLTVVGELAAGIAHEIRNPLTSIKGFIQLFQQGMVKQEFIDIIMREFDRIEEIIREFLNLAKPQEIQLKNCDLISVFRHVSTLLESEASLQNVQIFQEFDSDIPQIMCDSNQIKQVFINLIKNSIESIENGGWVKIKASKEKDRVLVKIMDNGVGISEERLKRLGEPFFSNKEKGTGLGLMTCFRVIKQHNGTINFKSKENQGTVVEVRLPVSL
ncbi:MAG TPA: EAL domain-containing protein [Chondromyces sp.]|nr:EAL domain-containing protein [Chondromyces sp.]